MLFTVANLALVINSVDVPNIRDNVRCTATGLNTCVSVVLMERLLSITKLTHEQLFKSGGLVLSTLLAYTTGRLKQKDKKQPCVIIVKSKSTRYLEVGFTKAC